MQVLSIVPFHSQFGFYLQFLLSVPNSDPTFRFYIIMAILVVGGNGKTATRLARFLQGDNIPFLLTSRKGAAGAPAGMPATKFDWMDKSTWEEPFKFKFVNGESISAVYITQPLVPDPWKPMVEFVNFAREKYGVKRFVNVAGSSAQVGGPGMGKLWEHFIKTKVDYCLLRPSWFMENLSEEFPHTLIRDQDKIYTACGDGKIAFISAIDIAAVAYHALVDSEAPNCDYRVLGPELLTYDQVAEKLSALLGRKIEHVKLTGEQRYQSLVGAGVPDHLAHFLTHIETSTAKGSEALTGDAVVKVTKRPPRNFDLFAQESLGAWMK